MGYPKQIYDRAWGTLDARRRAAREEAAARREEIHQRIPEVVALEREMAAQAASITRAVISDPERAEERIEALARENLALQERRAKLLTKAGYPQNYLEETYTCGACKDTGAVGHATCLCFTSLLKQEAAARLGRLSPIESCTFDNFSLDYYTGETDETGISPRTRMKENLETCRRWASSFSLAGESLMLMGRTGLGKTHLSIAMAGEVTEQGYGVVYTSVQRMMDILEADKFSREAGAKEQYLNTTATYLDCDLLVLDDLGTEFHTQFVSATLFNILNTRLVEGRPTVISTNLELTEIESRYSQRMVSRLICGYRVMRFAGKDIRYQKKVEASRRK